MLHARGFSKSCTLLAVLCGKLLDTEDNDRENKSHRASYPFPRLVSSGRLEVHTLINPSIDRLREVLKSVEPNFLYFQGMLLENEERIGSVVWGGTDLSDPTTFSMLIGPPLPTTVYLEFPRSEKVAEALRSQGIPYVIYWRNELSSYMASHFRQALLSVIQSSCSHTWDAFHLAHASFRLYCLQSNIALAVNNQKINSKLGPCILGDAPKFNIPIPGKDPGGTVEEEEEPFDNIPTIKIYDNNVDLKFLICGLPCTLDVCLLSTLKDGLNALLNVEIRGSKLHNRVSATPPSVQAGTISRGVITMRCDLTTCSSTHISLLVSGSAHTCFNDQLLENHIKKELIENSQLVHLPSDYEEKHQNFTEPRKSSSIACGSSVFEVCMKVPTWASQVLKQLAPQICYRSLVSLGVASVQGSAVASFEKDDSSRLLFFFSRQGDRFIQDGIAHNSPIWLKPPTPSRKRSMSYRERTNSYGMLDENAQDFVAGSGSPVEPTKRRAKFATMKPIPHVRQHKMLTFSEMYDSGGYDVNRAKPNLAVIPCTRHIPPAPVTHKKAASNCFQPQQIISLNPLPLKKHGCNRTPIQTCPEEEFLRDVMEFLILRGHSRLVPQGGISEFPDAILNAKRLDLYNLYREVVTRGGFHVGNGINWKGQVFSKMRNHTVANRMTGVGNTLKRHYETYLLEYELAHDDVDGECCILCHSSAPGDWVNCGLCGEWAHFGCDRRQGLGAFKDYAKTDGLDYVCPPCSLTNYKKKSPKVTNGFPQGRAASRLL